MFVPSDLDILLRCTDYMTFVPSDLGILLRCTGYMMLVPSDLDILLHCKLHMLWTHPHIHCYWSILLHSRILIDQH